MQHFPQAREKNARETYFDAIGRSRRAITVIILRRHSFNVSQSGCIEVDEGRLVVIFFFASFSIASLLISLSFCLVGLLLSSSGCVLVRSVNAVQHYSRLFGESLFNAFSRSFPASNRKTARINNQGFFELSYPRLFDLIVPASYCCSSGFPSSPLQFSVFPWKIIHCSPSREIHFSVSCNRLVGNAEVHAIRTSRQHPGVEDPAAAFPAGAFLLHYARFIVSRTKADSPWRVLTLGSDCDEHLRFYE